jgi:hypothetical protein
MTSTTAQDRLDRRIFRAGASSSFRERREALIRFFADRTASGYLPRLGFIEAAARLKAGRSVGEVEDLLTPLLDRPQGDVFWMYSATLVAFLGQGRLPQPTQKRLRSLWKTYRPYRGDTENHWAMYYASLYLMAQLRPGLSKEEWFNGKSSGENRHEARDYLLHWIDRTTQEGQGEFDSPHYLCFYVAPLSLLYGFADEAPIRTRARMMLDHRLADFGAKRLNGLYAGAFSRIYPRPTLERWRNGSTSLAWLLFGNVPFRPDRTNVVVDMHGYRPHGIAAVLAMSGYEPPDVLHSIATDRSEPYVHRERKRTRDRIRYSEVRSRPVYKYTYMREEYALGSIQGGILQPIQQHTWELQWATGQEKRERNVLFTLHPSSSPRELGMYFPEEPKRLTETVVRGEKGTYDSPKKWTGASPYERVAQIKDALVVLYDIPEGTRFSHVSGYFSRDLGRRADPGDGWIFAKGGQALIAYHPLAEYEWKREESGDWRLHSAARQNGAVLQVAPAGAYASFAAFQKAVRDLPLEGGTAPVPQVDFTSLRGDRIEWVYGDRPVLNGTPVDRDSWPLFDGPFMQSDEAEQAITLRDGSRCRTLNFNDGTITDRPGS